MMEMSDRGLAMLVASEGVVPAPYLDSVGVWTYGVGHTAAAGAPIPAEMPRGMPHDVDAALRDVMALFRKDIAKYEAGVNAAVKVPLQQHEFDALVSFHYNTGAIARAKLTQHLNAGDRVKAAQAFMGWLKPVEIKGRREEEQRLFSTGVYGSGTATVWSVGPTGKVVWKPLRRLSQGEMIGLMRGGSAVLSKTAATGAGAGAIVAGVVAVESGAVPWQGVLAALVIAAVVWWIYRRAKS